MFSLLLSWTNWQTQNQDASDLRRYDPYYRVVILIARRFNHHVMLLTVWQYCYASAFRRRRHYVFGSSVRPSVRPKPGIPSFNLYMGPLVHPTNRDRFTACPSFRLSVRLSVRPGRFLGICRRTHGGNGLKFCMLMYLDHLQNWIDHGHGLLIFPLLAPLWLSETGQMWAFRAFPGERMEGMACNFACCCILTTFRTGYIMVMVCWFFKFWHCFDIVKWAKFGVSGHFLQNPLRKWPNIFACWCILTTFRTDKILITVCWFF